jgi:hypothetical protein
MRLKDHNITVTAIEPVKIVHLHYQKSILHLSVAAANIVHACSDLFRRFERH